MLAVRTSLALLLLVLLVALLGCDSPEAVPGDEAFDPLAASGPSETVARAMRLGGFEQAIVGEAGGTATVWIRVPSIDSAADVELAWQAGVASLVAAYPSAKEYVVQIASEADLLEVRVNGVAARDVVEDDDADDLKSDAEFAYLGAGSDPSSLPSGSYDATPEEIVNYLDTKNRVNGLVGPEGLATAEAAELLGGAESARASVPGVPAIKAGEDAGLTWSARSLSLLDGSEVAGAAGLRGESESAAAGMSREQVQAAREWFHVVSAVEASTSYGSVLSAAHATGLAAGDSEVSDEDGQDAILVAIRDRDAPQSAKSVTKFERVESADTSGTGEADQLPDRVIAANGGESAVIAYMVEDGSRVVETEAWLAYDRADDTRYWLAGEDAETAFTDASLHGWVYQSSRAALVDANDVGLWLGVFPTR